MYTFLKAIDWKELKNRIQEEKLANKKKKIFFKAIGKNRPLFLSSVYPILGSIKPYMRGDKYSATETFANIPDEVQTPFVKFSKAEFREYFMFINDIPPSTWVDGPMRKFPEFSRLVPIMLATMKQLHNINYEDWDFSDPAMEFMMNKDLFETIQFRDKDFSEVDITALTEAVLTVKTTGKVYSATQYPSSKNVWVTDEINVSATKPLALMLTKVWVASPGIRTKYMVLDPNNWDYMPEVVGVVESVAPF